MDGGIEYSFQVFYNTISSGCCRSDLSDIESYSSQLLPMSSYVVCPGVGEYPPDIRFKTKNLVIWKETSIVTSQTNVVNGMLQIMFVILQTIFDRISLIHIVGFRYCTILSSIASIHGLKQNFINVRPPDQDIERLGVSVSCAP